MQLCVETIVQGPRLKAGRPGRMLILSSQIIMVAQDKRVTIGIETCSNLIYPVTGSLCPFISLALFPHPPYPQ